MLPSIILNVIFFIVAWIFKSKWFKIKVHIHIINSKTSSILIKAIMSSQNNMAKESSSLQNHIVWSSSIFVTQECSHLAHSRWKAKQLFHTLATSNFFQLSCNTWAWAMDIALWVEWNIMMGVMWRRQKRRKSHIDAANQRAMEMPINWCQCKE